VHEWEKFTIHAGIPADGEVTGFTLNLDGRPDELSRVIRAVWNEMVKISNENNAEVRRMNDESHGSLLRFLWQGKYDGPTGDLHVRRKFP
jgi:hypothetical protein